MICEGLTGKYPKQQSISCTVGQVLDHLISILPRGDAITVKFTAHTGWKREVPFEKTMADLLDYRRAKVSKGDVLLTR